MDEFDKIRELSEDLSNRKEPVFTGFLKNNETNQTPFPLSENEPATPFLADIPLATPMSEQNFSKEEPFKVKDDTFSAYEIEKQPLSLASQPPVDDKINFIPMDEVEEKSFPSMKIHLILISVLLCVLVVSLFGFFMFQLDFDDTDEIATITASQEAVKEAPIQAGGMTIPDQDKLVYNRIRTDNVTTKVESLFPEPEKPIVPQILAIEKNAPDAPFVKMDKADAVNPFDEKVAMQANNDKPAQAGIPAKSAVLIQEPEKPVLPPVVQEQTVAPIQPKKEVITLPTVDNGTAQTQKEVKPVAKELWRVQLFASNNKEAVEKVWARVEKKHNKLLSNMSYLIKKVEIPMKGTYYRLQVGQFPNREMADGLCSKLRALKQDCIPTR